MIVTARAAAGRSVSADDFADLTRVTVTDVGFTRDGLVAIEFDAELPHATVAAVRRRVMSTSAAEEEARAEVASLPDVTLTQDERLTALEAQVCALARIVNGTF